MLEGKLSDTKVKQRHWPLPKNSAARCLGRLFPPTPCIPCLLGLLFLLQSCNSTRFLDTEKGEQFLVKNKIEIKKPASGKIKNKSNLEYELTRLFKQKPNRKFFGVPRQFFFYASQDTLGKSDLGKTAARVTGRLLGEDPVFLDSTLAKETADAMSFFLQNKGYFYAETEYQISTNKKGTKATVTYFVQPEGVYKIDTVEFRSKDTAVQRILNRIAGESFLKKDNPVDIKLYEQEVSRITQYLRNNGYAYFYPQYVSNLEGIDSSNADKTVKIRLEVLTPPARQSHQLYTIGNIYVNPDFNPSSKLLPAPDTLIDGIFFANLGNEFKIKPRTLTNSIFFRSGDRFDQSELDNTIRQLGGLGVFRPPTIRYEEDSLNLGVLNFYVLLSPNKKWEFGTDFDLSTTERRGIVGNRNLIGLSFSPSLRNRNFLRGAELLVTNVDLGIELAPFEPRASIVNSLDFRLQWDLYFPRFSDYFKFWRRLNKWGICGDKFYEKLRKRATSRFSAGYNVLILLDNYQLQFANLAYGYDVPLSSKTSLSINHFGADLLIPRIVPGSAFDTLLNEQPFLKQSFSKQFITGLVFRDLNFVYSGSSSLRNSFWYFRAYFDLSGLEVMGANVLFNAISGKSPDLKLFNVDFSHYAKVEIDGSHHFRFGPSRSLVARFNAGLVLPYYQSEAVPYVKQFFVGGPNSIRGWYARALGPGLYRDPLTDDPKNRNLFYQSGDLKIEFNLEYRFLLMRPFGLFNLFGATYLDIGNVWTVEKDPNRPGAEFSLTRSTQEGKITSDVFLNEMAMGTGFGTRWDFTYFVFRLDFGVPLKNNFPDPARNNSYWYDFSKWQLRDVVLNLGLGYPF
jgi:hypothetical protein